FSSRRRHTRFSRDWSSDVCSSDLSAQAGFSRDLTAYLVGSIITVQVGDLVRSEERREGKSVDLGGRRIIKKKKKKKKKQRKNQKTKHKKKKIKPTKNTNK